MSTKIGFIGQGWIGKHYADDFESRGYDTVRFGLEDEYKSNKGKLKECNIVFIAVPTPTTPMGFDDSIVRRVLALVGDGNIAIIKSTITPGTTESLQKEYSNLIIFHSPEFLRESSAAHDAANPDRNIVGTPKDTEEHREAAQFVLKVLPFAPYSVVMTSLEAELLKYVGNCFLYSKVIFMNILYDTVTKTGASWERVREAMVHDPRIGESHTNPVHEGGRGAGGHCFIKDFEAFRDIYNSLGDKPGSELLRQFVDYNNRLLIRSGKDLDLLAGVYGEAHVTQLKEEMSKSRDNIEKTHE